MRVVATILAAAVFFGAVVGGPRRALAQPAADISAEQVRDAIKRGCEYLLNEQNARGMWNELPTYEGGVTSLCTLAGLPSRCSGE